jgi:Zn finger protein HypA/HybF involved in hydrogenase expression
VFCLGCGEKITRYYKHNNKARNYCNSACRVNHNKKIIFDAIENNNINLENKITEGKWVKKYLIEKHGEKCMECGWDKKHPITGNVPIELEHIDGDSENNKLENLKLLCPNCHSLTPTYKALNKGNGRHSRMERYKEGKSY